MSARLLGRLTVAAFVTATVVAAAFSLLSGAWS